MYVFTFVLFGSYAIQLAMNCVNVSVPFVPSAHIEGSPSGVNMATFIFRIYIDVM